MRLGPRAGRLAARIALAASLTGCGGNALVTRSTDGPAWVVVPATLAGVRDGRARFREVFCEVLRAHAAAGDASGDCAQHLLRLADEPITTDRTATPAPKAAPPARPLTVAWVLGFGSDCAGQSALVEQEMRPFLASLGHTMRVLRIDGLGSSDWNARVLRDALLADDAPHERVVLIGHSKGAVDALQLLVEHPQARRRVEALVSLAGAIGGSPLANLGPRSLLQAAPWIPGLECAPGDLGAIDSLRPTVRQSWLARHRLPQDLRTYSIATMPDPARLAPGLIAPYRLLESIDPRNDGNVLTQDQMIPGSTLLAYLDADHWAIGSDLSASPSALVRAAAGNASFPRRALIEAILRTVAEDAATATGPR